VAAPQSTSLSSTATATPPPPPPPPPSLFCRNLRGSGSTSFLPLGFTVPPLFTPQEEKELRKRREDREQEGQERRTSSSSSASSRLARSSPTPFRSPTLPRHVGIILDGNTRWARRQGLPSRAGHAAGALALSRAVECCRAWGVERLTVFAFSSENWTRPRAHVASVLAVARRAARELSPALAASGVTVRFVGDRSSLPRSLVDACEAAEAATATASRNDDGERDDGGGNEDEEEGRKKGLLLTVALAYGARADAAAAARALAAACVAGELDPASIDERTFASALSTAVVAGGGSGGGGGSGAASDAAALGDVDLLIRTAGERRLSNFLLLESAYAELVFLDELWPDVGAEELRGAVREFMRRERRFGGKSG